MGVNESLSEKIMQMNERYERLLQEESQRRVKEREKPSHLKSVSEEKSGVLVQEMQKQVAAEKEARLKYQYET